MGEGNGRGFFSYEYLQIAHQIESYCCELQKGLE